MIGIYKITNMTNGKSYIGQSVDIERRWMQHKNKNTWKDNPSMLIYKAMKNYGLNNFRFSVVELCTKDKLDEKEKHWIKVFGTLKPNGYNSQIGGKNEYFSTIKKKEWRSKRQESME